jgi:hypothetical protein
MVSPKLAHSIVQMLIAPNFISIVAKTADLILIMLDATKSLEQRRLLELELDAVGIRLNAKKPAGRLKESDHRPDRHHTYLKPSCVQTKGCWWRMFSFWIGN